MYRRAMLTALLSAIAAVSLFLLYLNRFEQEMSGGERVRVLVALRPLEPGEPLVGDALSVRELPRAYVEDRSIRATDRAKVLGLRVGGLVQAQQTLMWTDLSVARDEHRDLSSLVQPGRRATTIRFRSEGGDALVRPGDYIDVIGVVAGAGEGRSASVLLQRVLVLAAGDSMSSDPVQNSALGGGRQGTLTLSVTLPQAQMLAIASERGVLSVALRSPEDNQTIERVPAVTLSSLHGAAPKEEPRALRAGPTELTTAPELRP